MRLRSGKLTDKMCEVAASNSERGLPGLGASSASLDSLNPTRDSTPSLPPRWPVAADSLMAGLVRPMQVEASAPANTYPSDTTSDSEAIRWAKKAMRSWATEEGIGPAEQNRRRQICWFLSRKIFYLGPQNESVLWPTLLEAAVASMHADLTVPTVSQNELSYRVEKFMQCLFAIYAMGVRRVDASVAGPTGLTVASLHAWLTERDLPTEQKEKEEVFLCLIQYKTSLLGPISVPGDFQLRNYQNLTSLPSGLSMLGSLVVYNCPNLTTLPTGLSVGGSLSLAFCPNLTSLPEGLKIAGHCYLSNMLRLNQLPPQFAVDNDLLLIKCPNLYHLPQEIVVGGDLCLQGCTNFAGLPPSITGWGPMLEGGPRTVDLRDTNISQNFRAYIETLDMSDMRFLFTDEQADSLALVSRDLFTIMTAWWTQHKNSSSLLDLSPIAWTMEDSAEEELMSFLSELRETAEYKNVNTRPSLVERTCVLLSEMKQDETLRVLCSALISDALHSCGDRVMKLMNQLELAIRVHKAGHGLMGQTNLEALGIGLMKLEIVHRHARATCDRLRSEDEGSELDEVEVFLVYETMLREKLALPVSTTHMLYGAAVTEEDLSAATAAAEQAAENREQRAAFFASWEPWQKHQRLQAVRAFDFSALPMKTLLHTGSDEPFCMITQEPLSALQQPVAIGVGQNARIYESAEFLQWWQEHGKEPKPAPQNPVRLSELWRPRQ